MEGIPLSDRIVRPYGVEFAGIVVVQSARAPGGSDSHAVLTVHSACRDASWA
jgi:hypothetical protein